MHYYAGKDTSQEYVHQVNIHMKKNVTATQIVKELVREEPIYFGPKVVAFDQLVRLIQKLIDNKGKKVDRLRLKPSNLNKQIDTKPMSQEVKKSEVSSTVGKIGGSNEFGNKGKAYDFDNPKGRDESKKEPEKKSKNESPGTNSSPDSNQAIEDKFTRKNDAYGDMHGKFIINTRARAK